MTNDNDEMLAIAHEIVAYLKSHPNAADSYEGVVKWWLKRQRYENSALAVNAALEYLVNEGIINKCIVSGNKIYSRKTKQKDH